MHRSFQFRSPISGELQKGIMKLSGNVPSTTLIEYKQSINKHKSNLVKGSLGIAPARNCTQFLKIGFVVAGGGFLFLFYPPRE